jgi:hypothetical protein
MVCIAKIPGVDATVTLFKTKDDTMNIFFMCCAHSLPRLTNNLKLLVLGTPDTSINTPLYVEGVLFQPINPCLDLALGVIKDPRGLNNMESLGMLWLFRISDNNDISVNTEVDVIFNNDERVNVITTSIISTNFEFNLGQNSVHSTAYPGGYLELELDARTGLTGALVINRRDKSVMGMITVSSFIANKGFAFNTNKNLCMKMFFAEPWIQQVTDNFYKITGNNLDRLKDILTFTNLESFTDNCIPPVNHLGADFFVHNHTGLLTPFYGVEIVNVHYWFNTIGLYPSWLDDANSIPMKTILNSNDDFLNWYNNHPARSRIYCVQLRYVDILTSKDKTVDLKDKKENILDLVYRANSKANVELTFQAQIFNDDGSVIMSKTEKFAFFSSPVVYTINTRSYAGNSFELCKAIYNKKNSYDHLYFYGMGINWTISVALPLIKRFETDKLPQKAYSNPLYFATNDSHSRVGYSANQDMTPQWDMQRWFQL